ncbi:hypothetical protein LD10_16470 [Neisseria meningitidis]|nr:hypothetical protein LD10_16470 [Neisseria meningitidis]
MGNFAIWPNSVTSPQFRIILIQTGINAFYFDMLVTAVPPTSISQTLVNVITEFFDRLESMPPII